MEDRSIDIPVEIPKEDGGVFEQSRITLDCVPNFVLLLSLLFVIVPTLLPGMACRETSARLSPDCLKHGNSTS